MIDTLSDNAPPYPELPRYRSHKVVQALKLSAVEINEDGGAMVAPEDGDYGILHLSAEWGSRFHGGEDDDPGYYVLYEDGYESWSPTKAFEEGYTRL